MIIDLLDAHKGARREGTPGRDEGHLKKKKILLLLICRIQTF